MGLERTKKNEQVNQVFCSFCGREMTDAVEEHFFRTFDEIFDESAQDLIVQKVATLPREKMVLMDYGEFVIEKEYNRLDDIVVRPQGLDLPRQTVGEIFYDCWAHKLFCNSCAKRLKAQYLGMNLRVIEGGKSVN